MSSASDPWYSAVEFTERELEFTPTASHTRIMVVETLSDKSPIAYAEDKLNIG